MDIILHFWLGLLSPLLGYGSVDTAAMYLRNSVKIKDSIDVWQLYEKYSAHDPMQKVLWASPNKFASN